MTALQLSIASGAIIALGAATLSAESRRAEACYQVQRTYQGSCPIDDEGVKALCQFTGLGCPATPTSASCENLGNPAGTFLLTCNYSS